MGYPTSFPLPPLRIKYKGLYDMDGLYLLIVQWIKARRMEFHETAYKHKVPSPMGAEQEISFTGEREVNEYVKFSLDVDMHLWDMTEVEVEKDGVKKKLTNARIEIVLSGNIELDYEEMWKQSNFFMKLRDWFYTYILDKEIGAFYLDPWYYRVQRLHTQIKDFLDMQAKGYAYEMYLGDK